MGSGIALTALLSDFPVCLFDVSDAMLEQAQGYIDHHLARKGKNSNLRNLTITQNLEHIGGAAVTIEAIPERLDLKQEMFSKLEEIVNPNAILATNTSTLPITTIAAATNSPQRIAGMHFFNPAPVMPLVEVVSGAKTSPETIESLVTLSERLGKTPVVVKDSPGFIVNRVARPFYGEALRLLGENVATFQQIDRIIRLGAGFRMGPFQLMDLIGIDVNYSAMKSMYEQTFGEPRYRPHPIQIQMVNQRDLGKKTGRGFYDYTGEKESEDFSPPKAGNQSGSIYISPGTWAPGLFNLCRNTGYKLTPIQQSGFIAQEKTNQPIGLIIAGRSENLQRYIYQIEQVIAEDALILSQCTDTTLIEIATWMQNPERLVGFDGIFISNGLIATLVANPMTNQQSRASAEKFFSSLGRAPIWINDSPALILPRVISMLSNEAAFAAGEGIAETDRIDTAMILGTNYPKGPIAWAREIGYHRVVEVLKHLQNEYGEERYRTAPLLQRWARMEKING
jgi:3-hydroxybutyryl-CoA dehydrogenase